MQQKRGVPEKVLRLFLAGAAGGGVILFSVNCLAARGASWAGTRAKSGTAYYLDCSAAAGGAGTRGRPWNAVDSVNNRTFGPGDTIFIRRGTTVTRVISLLSGEISQGVLYPKGSGVPGAPIVIDAYGSGPKPIIDAQGQRAAAGIYLNNQEYWTIQNMEVRNDVSTHDSASQGYRWGIYVFETDGSNKHGIHIKNNIVRTIYGYLHGGGYYSEPYGIPDYHRIGGIFVYSICTGKIDSCLIEGNEIYDVWGVGIYFLGAGGSQRWDSLSVGVVVRGNTIRRTAGDGIIVSGTDNELIEYNIADSVGQLGQHGTIGVVGGIWPVHHRNGLIQYNEVSHTKMWWGDGMAFDNDNTATGSTVFQYNYTHDNGGAFFEETAAFVVSGAGDTVWQDSGYAGTIVRYNISVNDGALRQRDPEGPNYTYRKNFVSARGNTQVYNNVIYTMDTLAIWPGPVIKGATVKSSFYNNIFWGRRGSSWNDGANSYDHNAYWGGCEQAPPADSDKIIRDPQFINAVGGNNGYRSADCYKLQPASPCIDAGRVIGSNGGHDFWGDTLYKGQPDIGAHESPAPARPR